tara:strand:- start:2681 stop:3616 length:936 start_codon:yes stop_codon:yes gene_type:complete
VKKTVCLIFLVIPLAATAQFSEGNHLEGKIIHRFSVPHVRLAHPIPSPSGDWITATATGYGGVYLIPLSDDGNIETVSSEPYTGFHRLFSSEGTHLYFVTRSDMNYRMRQVSLRGDRTRVVSEPVSPIRGLLKSREGLIILRDREGGMRAWPEIEGVSRSVHEETVCYHDDHNVYIRHHGKTEVSPRQGKERVLAAVPSPDYSMVAFHEAGQKLYLWNVEEDMVLFLGSGENPDWHRSSLQIVAMLPEDDGHRITSSQILVYSIQGKNRHHVALPEESIYMNPKFMPDGEAIVVEERKTGTIVVITLGESR